MWSQWPGAMAAPMPPMPMTAAPPQPAAPPLPDAPPPPPPNSASAGGSFIGPMQPSTPLGSSIANAACGNGNPYEQYTAAQYAAMTPEQQYALQQHWQQWQTYQQEYAKWHAQYGEQYKREMEAAAAAASTNPIAAAPNAYASAPYYPQLQPQTTVPQSIQQPPPIHQLPMSQEVRPQTTSKIMGQPQMYTQPPPAAAIQSSQWNTSQQMPDFNTVSVNYNQPPPNFNAQLEKSNFGTDSINQNQKLTQPQPRERKSDDTSSVEFRNQWQDRQLNQNRSNMWNSASHQKDEGKSNSGNEWTKSAKNHGKSNNFGNNSNEPKNDNNRQNFYVAPNKCDESNIGNNDSSGPDNRFNTHDHNRFASNNDDLNDFDKDKSIRFGNNNNNFSNSGPRNFDNAGPKIVGNNNGQNPFNKNVGNNRSSNSFGNSDRVGFDERKNFGNEPSHNFGRGKGNIASNNCDNNSQGDRYNNSENRFNQAWNSNDFNNQAENNRRDNNRNSNQNFASGGSNFNNGGGFNRSTGANQNQNQNMYPSGSWQQQQNARKPDLDDASFDRMFEQWEKQFEDWKQANINHPDREEYRRYEQEFENQRRRIAERREQMRRRRIAQMGGNINDSANSDSLSSNQSEQQQQLNQPQQSMHQQQYQQQQFQQQKPQNHPWRQPDNLQNITDTNDRRNLPKQRKTSERDNNDDKVQQQQRDRDQSNVKSLDGFSQENSGQDEKNIINQTAKVPAHSTPKTRTFVGPQSSQNQGLQQKQSTRFSHTNQTPQDVLQKQDRNAQVTQQKSNQGGQANKQEGQQKPSINQQDLMAQTEQQKGGTQPKQNPQRPQAKQNPQVAQQKQNQQGPQNTHGPQQKQNQTPKQVQKQATQLKSNQPNSNQATKQKENEQKSQQQQQQNKQSQPQKQNTQQKTNQTAHNPNLNKNPNLQQQKQQTQSQAQGNAAQANTPKLNQLKPLPQRQSSQQRRQAQKQLLATSEVNKSANNNTSSANEIANDRPTEQQAASTSLLGKRKSRFDSHDEVRTKKEAIEVITLDDEDEDEIKDRDAGKNKDNSVDSIFKKSEGIPGLDLVDESVSKRQEDTTEIANSKPSNENNVVVGRTESGDESGNAMKKDQVASNVSNKIPSLFDVVIEKPADLVTPSQQEQKQRSQLNDNVDNSSLMAQLHSCTFDPQLLQQISLAVAQVQGREIPAAPSSQLLEQLPGLLQQAQQQQQQQQPQQQPTLSFAEWQRRKTLTSNDGSNMFGGNIGNNRPQNFNNNAPNFGNNGPPNFGNDGPNMFNNNGPNNFGNNGRLNNFRNNQMMNPNDFNNRRNNNNDGPGFNRGIGPMAADISGGGCGPNNFNKNESFGDNPFRRSGGPAPPMFHNNNAPTSGVFDGTGGGFGRSDGLGGQGSPMGRFGGPGIGIGGEPSNMDFMRRNNGNNKSRSVGPSKNEDFYRPIQVFDYQNSSAATPKVIDYGHKHRTGFGTPAGNKDETNSNATVVNSVGVAPAVGGSAGAGPGAAVDAVTDEYKPVKTFDYGHASNPQIKSIANNLPVLSRNAIRKRNRRKNKLLRQQQQEQQQQSPQSQQPSLKRAFISPQQQQQQLQQQKEQNTNDGAGNLVGSIEAIARQNITATTTSVAPATNIVTENTKQVDKNADLEDISDTDDIDAIENTATHVPTFKNPTEQLKQSAIFPSTSNANEQISAIGTATHLQMSIPTMENCNTVAIEEILEKPGRLARPKRICIILRGPPGSGKSHIAKLIKEKETEMGGANPRILSIDDYFLIENDYEEKCPKTGKKIPKKEILYEYDDAMEETYMQYLIKSYKKTISDNLYDFIIVDCNNSSLRTLNEFYCHAKDSGFMPYIVDLFCDLETCLGRNPHERSERDIKDVIDNWCETPFHYIKLNVSILLENVVEMEDVENMATDDISDQIDDKATSADAIPPATAADECDDSNGTEGTVDCGFLKSKWENDNTSESLARLDGTNKLKLGKRKATSMADYLQLDDWQPRATSSNGQKRVRWADIEEKHNQEKMRAIGFVVGQTDWKRMMDPDAGNRALNRTKFIERVNKRR